jgi:hypothetical protein
MAAAVRSRGDDASSGVATDCQEKGDCSTMGLVDGVGRAVVSLGNGSLARGPKPKDKNRHQRVTIQVVRREGLEPPASWSVARRSIQLSYRRIFKFSTKR